MSYMLSKINNFITILFSSNAENFLLLIKVTFILSRLRQSDFKCQATHTLKIIFISKQI